MNLREFERIRDSRDHHNAALVGVLRFGPALHHVHFFPRLLNRTHYNSHNGATSGFEMCFALSTFGAGGPNQNTSRLNLPLVVIEYPSIPLILAPGSQTKHDLESSIKKALIYV